ncbi:hypothetical protein GCM10011581_24320 [Saccharopolyspora subtropica]|uniref:Guanylate cyclase domain-containing protein n=2 Tax=Saccharopolyspora thermophila TaxID=89367 RepID=A0A917JWQ1_9PSEU|nr:hypothetical protein GCM10011581_24320 [Saccharopolyspora subtropica]
MDHELELPDSTRALGEYRGILAVDVHCFGRHNDAQQKMIIDLLPEIIQQSASRAGLPQLWDGHFRAPRGDGYLFGFHVDLVSAVVDRFFDALQGAMRQRAAQFRAAEITLRVRTSLHLGPVQSFDALLTDSPSGKVMVDTGRMVDADSVRALLDHSDPNVTFVASVISNAVMEHVVRAGRTARKPSEFVEAPLQVDAKDYSGVGYLRVPAPSQKLLSSGLLFGQPEPDPEPTTEKRAIAGTANDVHGRADNVAQTHDVSGGINQGTQNRGIVVKGNGNTTAGHGIDQSKDKQEFSGHFYTHGDANFGPSSGRRINTDDTVGR